MRINKIKRKGDDFGSLRVFNTTNNFNNSTKIINNSFDNKNNQKNINNNKETISKQNNYNKKEKYYPNRFFVNKNNSIGNFNITKNNLIILFSVLLLISLSSFVFALPGSMTLQGKLTNQAGAAQSGTFNFSFKIYDAYTGGNVLWQDTDRNITTDANGIYDVILHNLSALNFSEQYYLGITVSEDD